MKKKDKFKMEKEGHGPLASLVIIVKGINEGSSTKTKQT